MLQPLKIRSVHILQFLTRNYTQQQLFPVQLAYNSYEKLYKNDLSIENNPLIIMHGLFGKQSSTYLFLNEILNF